jgi:hypothetical protein
MIRRTYSCLNRHCRHEFDSDGDFPPCPRCRGVRVQWVPKPVAINSSRTAAIDATARQLAADFGLTNFRSPQAGQAAVAPAPPPATANMFEPQKGWRIQMPDAALQGGGHAVCAPTGVSAKVKVDPNSGALKENPGYGLDRMRAATQIEGTHRGRIEK